MSKEKYLRQFREIWPEVAQNLDVYVKRYDPVVTPEWLTKSLEYNVSSGKKNRGLATITAYEMLVKSENLTKENLRLVHCLCWCLELLQSSFLMVDDILDGGETRRGRKCWYKLDGVGLGAANDAIMIEMGIYHLLKEYFGSKEYYKELVDLFHETTFITTVGQLQDMTEAQNDVTTFTWDKYKRLAENKTAYYSFYMPVALAMHVAGYKDPEIFRKAKKILLDVGCLFQVQDDFLDCFGDPTVTGKIGTDIQDGKCTWLAVVAIEKASDEQKQMMKQCYGQKDPKKVERVKKLYEELSMQQTYKIYEEKSYKLIEMHIQKISGELPQKLFYFILDKIYQRNA